MSCEKSHIGINLEGDELTVVSQTGGVAGRNTQTDDVRKKIKQHRRRVQQHEVGWKSSGLNKRLTGRR